MNVSFENVVEVRKQILLVQLSNDCSMLLCYVLLVMNTDIFRKMFRVKIRVNGKDYKTFVKRFR